MKFERINWGIVLLFIGGVLLLQNFNVINFYWRQVWQFWPVFLIISGVNLLFNRNGSQLGSIITTIILVCTLGFVFVKGQEKQSGQSNWNVLKDKNIEDFEEFENTITGDEPAKNMLFWEDFTAADSVKHTTLNIAGGGATFKLDEATDSLFLAEVKKGNSKYSLTKNSDDSTNVITFKMGNSSKNNWNFDGSKNEVQLALNSKPIWELNLSLGAGALKFELENYKIRTLNFDGGAADVAITLGNLLPITDVNVKTGVANVEIKVPATSGCRITAHTGLTSKDFKGFIKVSENVYETPNYKTSKNKVFIKLDGGLSNFEVDTY